MGAVEDVKMDGRKNHQIGCRMSFNDKMMLGTLCKENGNIDMSDMIRKLVYDEYKRTHFKKATATDYIS